MLRKGVIVALILSNAQFWTISSKYVQASVGELQSVGQARDYGYQLERLDRFRHVHLVARRQCLETILRAGECGESNRGNLAWLVRETSAHFADQLVAVFAG